MVHLNTNTLIGFTEKRGNAWHYRAVLQGAESNHYPGAIPVADVRRRLLNWQAVPRRVAIEFPATFETMTHLNDAGEPVRWAVQQNRQAISPSNRDVVMGLFKDGYKICECRCGAPGWRTTRLGAGARRDSPKIWPLRRALCVDLSIVVAGTGLA